MKQLRVYLAGKVEGTKWKVVPKDDPRFNFFASDGSNHSEHLTGICLYEFEECNNKSGVYSQLVQDDFMKNARHSHILLAYLDTTNSYGSIAEIAWASAMGIPCHVVVERKNTNGPEDEDWHPMDEDGMFDAYYFVCSFPNVTVYEAQNVTEGRRIVHRICNLEHSKRFVNSVKFMMD